MESPPPATAAMASQKGKALMGSLSCSLSPAAAAACSKEKTDGPSCQGLFCLMTSSKRHTRYPSDASPEQLGELCLGSFDSTLPRAYHSAFSSMAAKSGGAHDDAKSRNVTVVEASFSFERREARQTHVPLCHSQQSCRVKGLAQ
eukprot:1157214-Pelagomonas_calceolata.AAC.8